MNRILRFVSTCSVASEDIPGQCFKCGQPTEYYYDVLATRYGSCGQHEEAFTHAKPLVWLSEVQAAEVQGMALWDAINEKLKQPWKLGEAPERVLHEYYGLLKSKIWEWNSKRYENRPYVSDPFLTEDLVYVDAEIQPEALVIYFIEIWGGDGGHYYQRARWVEFPPRALWDLNELKIVAEARLQYEVENAKTVVQSIRDWRQPPKPDRTALQYGLEHEVET